MTKTQPKLTLTRQIVSKLTPLKETEVKLVSGGKPTTTSTHINNWTTFICCGKN